MQQSAERLEVARWTQTASVICAVLLGVVFLVSGGWKVLNPAKTGELLEQARVPAGWGAIGASTLGALELFTALLLFVPRWRKLGGVLGTALLVFFIGWVAFFYHTLVGQECSCFPLIKRTVGPGFFIGDAVMLAFAVAALLWSPAVRRLRAPTLALVAIAVFAAGSFAYSSLGNRGLQAPTVTVDGKNDSMADGKVFLFFYDPQCMHCDAAARFMAKLKWTSSRIVAVPTTQPEFAAAFLHDTGLKAGTSLDVVKLRKVFQFVDPPYGVALVDGHQVAAFSQAQFNVPSPKADLEKLGFVE